MDQRVDQAGDLPSARSDGEASEEQAPTTRPRRWVAVSAVLFALLAGGGFYWWQHQQGVPAPAAANASALPPAPVVTVANPLVKTIQEWDDYPGQFSAIEHVEIKPQVSGYLKSVHFKDGQMVKKDDLLYVIDKRPFEIELQSAKAQLDEARAQLSLANRQLRRAEKLLKGAVVPESDYDDRLETVSIATAAVAVAEAQLSQAELNLDYTEIRSPLDGRIGTNLVDVGNLIHGGTNGEATLMATVVSLDPILFSFNISESNFLAYQRAAAKGALENMRGDGVPAFIRLTDEIEFRHEGRIDFIDNVVDETSGTITVRGRFANPDLLFTPGQFARIRVPGSDLYEAILVPESAILTDQSQKILLVAEADNKVGVRIVRLGPPYEGFRIVREGLKPADRIIINGLTRVRPGMVVDAKAGEIAPGS